ncbi:CcmD family protein [Bacteroidetes/Chlorobi group bacterium MS-B_bin-24]|jgi:CcmD family protein|nr:MAG: CcmD family protein [Bacteroidetes/Chlorobi group bacterium MS-B_bin-24]
MFDFLVQNQIYIVLIIVIIIWLGLMIYLLNLEKKVKELENKLYSREKKGEELK